MKILAQSIEQKHVSDLHLHPKNPRKGNVGRIAESIKANGFAAPLLVQRSTGHIIAGNHRYRAGCSLGMMEFPCVLLDVDDSTALRLLVADNRTSDLAENDNTQLSVILQDLAADPAGLEGTAFTADELATMLVKSEPPQEFKEYDESAAENVKMQTCPSCGHEFPR